MINFFTPWFVRIAGLLSESDDSALWLAQDKRSSPTK